MALADVKGRFLFEVRPDLFPEGFLTLDELDLWAKWYKTKEAKMKHG